VSPLMRSVACAALCLAAGHAGAQSAGQTSALDESSAGTNTQVAAALLHAPYSDLRAIRPIAGDAEAGRRKSESCAGCHGEHGIAIVQEFPSLAGQHADFTYWQLVEYKRDAMPGGQMTPPMTPLAADLSDADMRDLAVYYAGLDPAAAPATEAAARPATAEQLQRGELLYLSGDPGRGIPPCQGCHGSDARGHRDALRRDRNGRTPYAAYPALRGQQAAYLRLKLAEYRDGKQQDSTTDFVMSGVAVALDDASIQDLSAWLASLSWAAN